MNGIERRIGRLEKELGSTDERVVVSLRRFSDTDDDGELQEVQEMQCGNTTLARRYDETEGEFIQRAADEALRLADPFNPCAVMIEAKHRTPCSEATP